MAGYCGTCNFLRWEVLAGIVKVSSARKVTGHSSVAASEVTDRNCWGIAILGVLLLFFGLFHNGDFGYIHQTRNSP